MKSNLQGLIARLNPYCTRALEGASGVCVNRSHYEVSVEHMLSQLLEDPKSDIPLLLAHFEIEPAHWVRQLQEELEGLKVGNPGKPVFSSALLNLFEEAWIFSSVELGQAQLRSAAILAALVDNPLRYGGEFLESLDKMTSQEIANQFENLVEVSSEGSTEAAALTTTMAAGAALEKFTNNFTAKAREGRIDPIFGRDREIRQMIDILGRRRKNNPIAVGDAGVGKTAVVEGLALKVAAGDVPEMLRDVEIIELDLGALQAGASVKGEFENRLKAVINEIKASEKPIILFIDEAHTLIGAGGAAGTSDAANLLKPALGRGELRTVAATTWIEYKKYFEKDPALARRFQPVKLDEPSVQDAAIILRGLREIYEKAHKVYIRDDAIEAAATMSARYVSGRLLPDKAVDTLDTACSRVNISLASKPPGIEDLERRIQIKTREVTALERDIDTGRARAGERLDTLKQEIETTREKLETASGDWQTQKNLVDRVLELRHAPETEETAKELAAAIAELGTYHGAMKIDYEVTPEVVADVVSDWTGVPVGSIVKDEAEALLGFKEKLGTWIKGQDGALDTIDSMILTARAGLQNPDQPLGVFLLVGPSGTGKTETAIGVANLMFGGEQFMTSINMSEYQEKHTVSRLIGSPAGYVGYGEGGFLTEAVRHHPYSVVLLDEVEKADLEVMNLFYQVFDKGVLSDGEGRRIDFKNTIIFLTSNLGSRTIVQCCQQEPRPSIEQVTEMIRAELQAHFSPALLARMTVVPFVTLEADTLNSIVKLKLDKVGKRLKQSQSLDFDYDQDVIDQIVSRCNDVEAGARNIDHIVNRTLLPVISTRILAAIGGETEYHRVRVGIGEQGEFDVELA